MINPIKKPKNISVRFISMELSGGGRFSRKDFLDAAVYDVINWWNFCRYRLYHEHNQVQFEKHGLGRIV